MIDGVIVTPLKQIIDERGKVMHMLRDDSEGFVRFGEVYFSLVYPGAIKGWHRHKTMTLNYAVPQGNVKVVLYDDRKGSLTEGKVAEIFLGPDNYYRVTVPPMIWNGFKGIGDKTAIVANCASIAHGGSNDQDRMDPFDQSIPYDWGIKHR
jgi:dTDP-4-dehydrorhamnose 3,5-epimerase